MPVFVGWPETSTSLPTSSVLLSSSDTSHPAARKSKSIIRARVCASLKSKPDSDSKPFLAASIACWSIACFSLAASFCASDCAFSAAFSSSSACLRRASFSCSLAFSLLFWWQKKPSYRMFVQVPGSIFIGLIGLYWTIERVVG